MSARDVRQQFARSAALYATSAVHARGKDLEVVVRLACPSPTDVVLDVSTGAEHTALALSPHVARVVATDLIPEMLEVARGLAHERKAANVEFQEADVLALPVADASFDLVTCRAAAHHYPELLRPVREMARVLRPGGGDGAGFDPRARLVGGTICHAPGTAGSAGGDVDPSTPSATGAVAG